MRIQALQKNNIQIVRRISILMMRTTRVQRSLQTFMRQPRYTPPKAVHQPGNMNYIYPLASFFLSIPHQIPLPGIIKQV